MPCSRLLIADAEESFSSAIAASAEQRGVAVAVVLSFEHAVNYISKNHPRYVLVDPRLPGGSFQELIKLCQAANREARLVVVTRYPSLACAVKAIKLGAWDYLAKPTTPVTVLQSLLGEDLSATDIESTRPLSIQRLEWEHIHRVLDLNRENISATARALGMHRRTLQRKLNKYPTGQ